jgi:hypothetical protein
LLRVLISGLGAIVILRVLPRPSAEISPSSIAVALARWCRDAMRSLASYDAVALHLGNRPRATALILLLLIAFCFGGWAVFVAILTA